MENEFSIDNDFDYEIVDRITNADYANNEGEKLRENCDEIKDLYMSGKYSECCGAVRKESEDLVRYIFKRLKKKSRSWIAPTAGEILNDPTFKDNTDANFYVAALDVQQKGSKAGAHKDQGISVMSKEECKAYAEAILKQFSVVLKYGIEYINDNLSSVRGHIEFKYYDSKFWNGKERKHVLEAVVEEVEWSDYTFYWYIYLESKGKYISYKDRTRSITISEDIENKKIKFVAKNNKSEALTLEKEYGPHNKGKKVEQNGTDITLPKLQGTADVKKGYLEDGTLVLEVQHKINNAVEPFCYRWGVRNADNSIFYFGPPIEKLPGKGDAYKTYKITETTKNGKSNIDKTYVCKITKDGFDEKGIISKGYKLKKEDFLKQISAEIYLSQEVKNGKSYIVPRIENKNFNTIPTFSWFCVGEEGVILSSDDRLEVNDGILGKTVFCKVSCDKQVVGEMESERCIVEDTSVIPVITPTPTKTNEPNQSTSQETILNIAPVDAFSIENTETITAPRFRCFDSNAGRLHYFVAPRNDHYCTNSLQYLDYNEFLYNLLKDQGYERIIIVSDKSEDRGDNYPVLTYDAFSQFSFLNPSKYNEKFKNTTEITEADRIAFGTSFLSQKSRMGGDEIRGINGGRRKGREQNQETTPYYGKRVIKTLSRKTSTNEANIGKKPREIFQQFIVSEVDEAMISSIQRTAIVIPIELFFEKDDQNGENSSWLDSLVEKRLASMTNLRSKNIIIVTADQKEDFYRLFSGRVQACFSVFDKEFAKAIASFQEATEPLAYCNAFVSELEKKGRILVAKDRPQIDEIANFFFMKKVQKHKGFERLPYSRVYSLAEFIFDKCATSEQTEKAFPSLESNTWSADSLDNLDLELSGNNETIESFIDVALGNREDIDKIWDKRINTVRNLKPTSIERINGTSERLTDKKTKKKYYSTPISRYYPTEYEINALALDAQEDLKSMIGLGNVKRKIDALTQAAINSKKRGNAAPEPGNYIFEGHSGTGKTEVARLMGKMLHASGLLRRGHTIEVSAGDLIAGYVGQTSIKTTKKCEEALDGVLFIDEAYQLVNTDRNQDSDHPSSYANEAYTTLLKFMEDHRSRICVIAAGYPNKMHLFRSANEGMSSRIPDSNVVRFDDYSTDELIQILRFLADKKRDDKQRGYVKLTDEFIEEARLTIEELKANKGELFGNGRDVRSLLEMSILNAEKRTCSTIVTLTREDIEANKNTRDPEAAERAWATLDKYVGLESIKSQLKKVIEVERLFGIISVDNMIFAGPPGTGKSEVAELVAPILKAEGILKTDNCVKAPIEKLKGRANGETEQKTRILCESAIDGVLFIDEAYGLVNEYDHSFKDSYAEAAYNEIMRYMTENKNRMVVIFAGYAELMDAFVKANPGMSRRVKVINFDPYSDDELYEIFIRKAKDFEKRGNRVHLEFSNDFSNSLKKYFDYLRSYKKEGFGNAGEIENLLIECSFNAGKRLKKKEFKRGETLILETEDIPLKVRESFNDSNSKETTPDIISDTDIINTAGIKPLLAPAYLPKDKVLNIENPFDIFDSNNPQEFYDHCKSATMRLFIKDSIGTMFTITPDGYAITCAHVVLGKHFDCSETGGIVEYLDYKNEKRISIKIPFDIVAVEVPYDLALIKVNADFDLPYLKVAPEGTVVDMTYEGHLYGFPDGKDGIKFDGWTISSEEERRTSGIGDTIRYLSVKSFPGDSGGPVVSDRNGLVIGVLQGAQFYSNGQPMSVMKPITNSDFWKHFIK